MPRVIPAIAKARALWNDGAFMVFVDIPRKRDINYFRLVRGTRHVEAGGKKWQGMAIAIEWPEDDSNSILNDMTVTIPNISRVPMGECEAYNELLGQPITVAIQHESQLTDFADALIIRHTIARVRCNEESFTMECAHPAKGRRMPWRRFTRREFPNLLPYGGR